MRSNSQNESLTFNELMICMQNNKYKDRTLELIDSWDENKLNRWIMENVPKLIPAITSFLQCIFYFRNKIDFNQRMLYDFTLFELLLLNSESNKLDLYLDELQDVKSLDLIKQKMAVGILVEKERYDLARNLANRGAPIVFTREGLDTIKFDDNRDGAKFLKSFLDTLDNNKLTDFYQRFAEQVCDHKILRTYMVKHHNRIDFTKEDNGKTLFEKIITTPDIYLIPIICSKKFIPKKHPNAIPLACKVDNIASAIQIAIKHSRENGLDAESVNEIGKTFGRSSCVQLIQNWSANDLKFWLEQNQHKLDDYIFDEFTNFYKSIPKLNSFTAAFYKTLGNMGITTFQTANLKPPVKAEPTTSATSAASGTRYSDDKTFPIDNKFYHWRHPIKKK